MHFELRHLRTLKAIHDTGGLARAADHLNITQSALSHHIRGLEDQIGMDLFIRRSKPMKLSPAGLRFLRAAEEILPRVKALQDEFTDLRSGRAGRLHIAIECHACFEWLFPMLKEFRKSWPDIDVDIRPGLAFNALPALQKEEVDLVVSSDPEDISDVVFEKLFDYSPVFVASAQHPFASKAFVTAADFRDQTLITYPVEHSRLDVFSQLLNTANIEPLAIRQVELTAVILFLVASNRGVSVLPDWVVREIRYNPDYVIKPLTSDGIIRTLYAAVRDVEIGRPYIQKLIELARTKEFVSGKV
ncbi:MAG: LysR family transcriptional regulator [Aestuariivita sp.]|nr:LysR family transcriptional regulator [Aestuariivita sp.]